MKKETVTFKLSYGGFNVGDKVYYPIVENGYGLGTVVAGKIERKRCSKIPLLPFMRDTATLIVKVGNHYFEEPAHKCYKVTEYEHQLGGNRG